MLSQPDAAGPRPSCSTFHDGSHALSLARWTRHSAGSIRCCWPYGPPQRRHRNTPAEGPPEGFIPHGPHPRGGVESGSHRFAFVVYSLRGSSSLRGQWADPLTTALTSGLRASPFCYEGLTSLGCNVLLAGVEGVPRPLLVAVLPAVGRFPASAGTVPVGDRQVPRVCPRTSHRVCWHGPHPTPQPIRMSRGSSIPEACPSSVKP